MHSFILYVASLGEVVRISRSHGSTATQSRLLKSKFADVWAFPNH